MIYQTLSTALSIIPLFLHRTLPLLSLQHIRRTNQHWTEPVITISLLSVGHWFPHLPGSQERPCDLSWANEMPRNACWEERASGKCLHPKDQTWQEGLLVYCTLLFLLDYRPSGKEPDGRVERPVQILAQRDMGENGNQNCSTDWVLSGKSETDQYTAMMFRDIATWDCAIQITYAKSNKDTEKRLTMK